MLEVQKYLMGGKSLSDLNQELGIISKLHDNLPLAILNYDQIESPKTHPVVRECRGLVLNTTDWSLVARSFSRFFNWGEVADEMKDFDFSDFIVQSKEDGSLVVLYWSDDAESWMANTRGSFATDNMQGLNFTWREGFWKALGVNSEEELLGWLNPEYTYICEFCSPWNKVVRRYEKPCMYLLTVFHGTKELSWAEVDAHCEGLMQIADVQGFKRPHRYEFKAIEEVQAFLQTQAEKDPTFEGVVICDHLGHRWKIKSATYLGLHKMRGEGDNLFHPKHLLPFILAGEEAELLTYFPECRETYEELKVKVNEAFAELQDIWAKHWMIDDQKEFALSIKDKTPFTSLLFNVRKRHGKDQKLEHLKTEWRTADSLILKKLT